MASSDSNPTVFVYEQSELNHGWLKACDGFEKIRISSQNDNLAEVGMREALLASELRVRDPAQALLFYVPVFEFASAHLGTCGNTTHTTRMAAANTALLASPWWKRHGGRDHLLASSAFSFGSGITSFRRRAGPLRSALGSAVVGRYKPTRSATNFGACIVAVPWASLAWTPPQREIELPTVPDDAMVVHGKGLVQRRQHRARGGGGGAAGARAGAAASTARSAKRRQEEEATRPRPLLLHFAGSLDVCCNGRYAA